MIKEPQAVVFHVSVSKSRYQPCMDVRWSFPTPMTNSGFHDALGRELASVHGVDHVNINRYSAEIDVAQHVLGVVDACFAVKAALQSPEVAFQLQETLKTTVSVQVVLEPDLLSKS